MLGNNAEKEQVLGMKEDQAQKLRRSCGWGKERKQRCRWLLATWEPAGCLVPNLSTDLQVASCIKQLVGRVINGNKQ